MLNVHMRVCRTSDIHCTVTWPQSLKNCVQINIVCPCCALASAMSWLRHWTALALVGASLQPHLHCDPVVRASLTMTTLTWSRCTRELWNCLSVFQNTHDLWQLVCCSVVCQIDHMLYPVIWLAVWNRAHLLTVLDYQDLQQEIILSTCVMRIYTIGTLAM